MKFASLVSVAFGILGIAGIIGAALAVLVTARSKGTIDVLERSADALEKNNAALVARVEILEATEEGCQRRLEQLEAMNKSLTETVTSAAKVDALAAQLTEHHAQVIGRLDRKGA